MPHPRLIRSDSFAYHIWIRSNNREWFYIPLPEVWVILNQTLSEACYRGGAIPYAFVLMSNHLHLILQTPRMNLDWVMQHCITQATRKIQRRAGRINHIFGARYKRSLLPNSFAMSCAYKYVLRNPVRAQLCASVDEYPFSTAYDGSLLPLSEGIDSYWSQIPRDLDDRLNWLNKPSPLEEEKLVGRALRRAQFALTTSSGDQKGVRKIRAEYLPNPVTI